MRIGVFGGSFDPVHNAHLIVARLALEQLGLDRVLFTVAGSQPFKQGRHGALPEHRLRMTQLAVEGLAGFSADGRELARPAPSYTIDTLRELATEMPEAELILLIGADVARGFPGWKDPDAIRAIARIAVCHRRDPLIEEGDPAPPMREPMPPHFDAELVVPVLDISSTAIRARAARGQSLAGWVPVAVADYIVASRLYGSTAG